MCAGLAIRVGSPACGSSAPATSSTTSVKLVQNPWGASRLDAAIANILLTTQMGMSVTVSELDEFACTYFVSGDEDACLEVWPSGHTADIASYIDTGKVEDAGLLGPVGKISWYVPTCLSPATPG